MTLGNQVKHKLLERYSTLIIIIIDIIIKQEQNLNKIKFKGNERKWQKLKLNQKNILGFFCLLFYSGFSFQTNKQKIYKWCVDYWIEILFFIFFWKANSHYINTEEYSCLDILFCSGILIPIGSRSENEWMWK